MRLGPINRRDRPRLAELLAATGAFNADEVQVALSLFDVSSRRTQPIVSSRKAQPTVSSRRAKPTVSSRRAKPCRDLPFLLRSPHHAQPA
jgi:hypothetical protein